MGRCNRSTSDRLNNFNTGTENAAKKPSFENEFHRYSHYLDYAIDSYETKTKLDKNAVVAEQIKHHHTDGFQARAYETENEFIVAIRGTEMNRWRDLQADLNLAIGKHPEKQIASMYKFFEEKDENGVSLKDRMIEAKKCGKNIVVTGHSLGGYLAQVAAKLYPDLFDEYYGYQAPGANFKDIDKIVQKNGKYYRENSYLREHAEQGFNASYENIPKEVAEPLLRLHENLSHKGNTKFFDVRADTDWAVIANLHNRERFGELIKLAGESHSSVALNNILKLYDFAKRHGMNENEVTTALETIYRKTGMPIEMITNKMFVEIGKKVGINDATDTKDLYERLNERFKELGKVGWRLSFQNIQDHITRLPYARKDVNNQYDLYKINFEKMINFGDVTKQQNNVISNSKDYKMTQSDYQNMQNGFASMSY